MNEMLDMLGKAVLVFTALMLGLNVYISIMY